MENEKLQLSDPKLSSMAMMQQLADNDADAKFEINGDMLMDRTKLFLVAQARNSLNRIIKLTSFLEKLEDKFIKAVSERLDNEPDNVTMIALSMETVSKLLQDANNTVLGIVKDEKLQQIVINTTNIITPDGSSATVIDPDSRDSVRNVAASLLSQLSKASFNDDEEMYGASLIKLLDAKYLLDNDIDLTKKVTYKRHHVMGYSDEVINDAFDGEPEAYWNID